MQLRPQTNSEQSFSDSIAIFANTQKYKPSKYILPNDIDTWIWPKNSKGEAPENIVNELCDTLPCPDGRANRKFKQKIQEKIHQQVWDVLADWAQAKVFINYTANQQKKSNILSPPVYLSAYRQSNYHATYFFSIALHYLSGFCQTTKEYTNSIVKVDIIPSDYDYSLLYHQTNITNHCKLYELLPKTYGLAIDSLEETNNANFIDGTLIHNDNKNILGNSD